MKKNYTFKYGDTALSVPLEESQVLKVLEGNKTEVLEDIDKELIDAIENPIDSASLKELAEKAGKIVLIVSDMTRFWMRQDLIIKPLVGYLVNQCGKAYEDLEILIATGTHLSGTEEEIKTIVTPEVYSKVKVVSHDARDNESLTYMGTTTYDTPVYVNKDAAEADIVIAIGAATYHVMAGFGGGRKSILPGISGMETIKHNHAYSLDPEKFITNVKIGNGKLEDNPLNEDMCEAAGMMKNLFVITLVTDTDFRLTRIFAGHWRTSWERACEEVRRIYLVPVEKKVDVIVTSCGGYPKDESLYQGTKTVDNVISALKDGGTLILFLEGRNGGGSPDYFSWIKPLVEGTFEKELRENFTVGGYIFFLNCEQAKRFNIMMYTSIGEDVIAPMGIKAYNNLSKLLEDANLDGKEIYVIPNGSTVLPAVTDEEK